MRTVALVVMTASVVIAADFPDCSLAPGWQQSGPRRVYEGENLYEYMDGNSEGYYIYGFVRMNGVTCKKAGDTIHVDVSEMADPESAYGMFAANRDTRRPIQPIGMGAQITPRKAVIAKDKYYLEIAAEPEKDHSATLQELSQALASRVSGQTTLPPQLQWFPTDRLTPGSPRLVPQSVLGIGALKRGYVAQYEDQSKAFVVTESSAAAAKQVFSKLAARFGDTKPATVSGADEAFFTTDQYLGRLIVFRKANRLGGYVAVPEAKDLVAIAIALAGQLRD